MRNVSTFTGVNLEQTSLLAFRELNPDKLTGMRRLVYNYIKEHPYETDLEIAQGLGFSDPNKVRPRRHELAEYGLIKEVGEGPCAITHKTSKVWEVCE